MKVVAYTPKNAVRQLDRKRLVVLLKNACDNTNQQMTPRLGPA